jgi:outer membrane PBP1 activator LpoA protein
MLHVRLRGRQVSALLLITAFAVLGDGSRVIPAAHAARSDDLAAAQSLAESGRHAEAARRYEQAAKRFFGWNTDVALLAAREYVAAGALGDAERMIDKVSRRARGDDARLVAELEAQIAQARQAREAPPATTTPLPGAPPAAPLPGASVPSAAGPPPAMLPSGAPTAVALLLPLSGRFQSTGAAVRDGFIAACLTDPADSRPRVAIYDTAAAGVVASYQQALADGAQFVVGPLMKDELAILVASQQFPVPTLALNTLAGGMPPSFLYQFSLDPEEEARAVARRIAEDGHSRGIALFPDNEWGQRVHDAFVGELGSAGVSLSSAQFYMPGARDFAEPLRAALGRFGGAGDRRDDKRKPAPRRDSVAEARDGPQFAFIAANAATALAMKPQLRFQMTYPLPVYATSDAWEASARAAGDMEGLVYPEMPWVLYGGQGATALWGLLHGAWSDAGRGRLRLYAFGFDAFRLTGELRSTARSFGLDGLTGELDVAADGRVLRRLEWASIQGGRPQAAGLAAPLPTPGEP